MRRILLFAHYNKYDELSAYVLHWLEALQESYETRIVISGSALGQADTQRLLAVCDEVLFFEGPGKDFGAWRFGLLEKGPAFFEAYDSITLMNDSCLGPLFPILPVLEEMEATGADFWGITQARQDAAAEGLAAMPKSVVPVKGQNSLRYLQSYFMVFQKTAARSEAFRSFWEQLTFGKPEARQAKAMVPEEARLTDILLKAGFSCEVFIPTETDRGIRLLPDISLCHPDILIEKRSPFIRIKSLPLFEYPKYLKRVLAARTDYDIQLLEACIMQNYPPHASIHVADHLLPLLQTNGSGAVQAKEVSARPKLRVAVHFHVFYPDLFEELLPQLARVRYPFDLYITTDTPEKKVLLSSLIAGHAPQLALAEVRVMPNRGRDILPWLQLSDVLSAYDVAGHFHTKKTINRPGYFGGCWHDELLSSLVLPMDEILHHMEQDAGLGVVITDAPVVFRKRLLSLLGDVNHSTMKMLWERMGLKKEFRFEAHELPVMPYGSMFWYRPKALQPLFDLGLQPEDFPEEPIAADGTLAHAIERMPVYIAWDQGYSFRVVMHPDFALSGFENQSHYHIANSFHRLRSSFTWRAGQLITWLPKRIHRLIKSVN
ncbi:MAG: rhamnan synthesis F family protein [Candidatus Cyclonatronum sp.]|uniref:rhamnan synthesis F family protein n=1 Tax=Cyclonatronum sp. TaxID=3024185 RepID=UPI0025BD7B2C|nr:rhamnan synthesis F family protein [Cyclonatronum sp.]MCH8488220.1 rhamnan synthesis F family protein [Cyclonatronum sp.]